MFSEKKIAQKTKCGLFTLKFAAVIVKFVAMQIESQHAGEEFNSLSGCSVIDIKAFQFKYMATLIMTGMHLD